MRQGSGLTMCCAGDTLPLGDRTLLGMIRQVNGNKLTLCSFNCNGTKRAAPFVYELSSAYDIVVLQEHWLLDTEIAFLNTVHPNIYSAGISAIVSGDGNYGNGL